MTTPRLDVRNVTKRFGDVTALDDVSLQVIPGEFITIIGPSGSGKSTLFNLIAGLTEPDSGEIRINDQQGVIGYMPQRDLLLPWRTVLENVIIPQEIKNVPRDEAKDRARQMLDTFGLEGFGDSYPAELSGGMRQRAALLRTILTDSSTLLFDEPFGALDALTRRELQDWLLDLWQEFDKTMVFVTHDVEEALYLGDRVIVLSERPGRVVRRMEVDLERPRRRRMMTEPRFGQRIGDLLEALGITT